MKTTNLTDITDLSDAALDVFMRVKGGEDVVVTHLSAGERYAVCNALGVKVPAGWLHDAPSRDVARGPARVARDYEGAILDRQDREENGDY